MRNPGFPVTFERRSEAELVVQLKTSRLHPAKGLIADGTIGPSILQLAEVLGAATPAGPGKAPQITATRSNSITIALDPRIFSQNWHLASVLNLIENAIFIGQDVDPSIISGTVFTSELTVRSVAEARAALSAAIEAARAAVIGRLETPGWPTAPRDVLYDLTWALPDPPSPTAAQTLSDRFWQINDLMTASAFEPEDSPLDWLEDDLLPHAAGLNVDGNILTAGIEMPPSDPALVLDLFEQVLQHEWDLKPIRHSAQFRDGW